MPKSTTGCRINRFIPIEKKNAKKRGFTKSNLYNLYNQI